MTKHPSPVPSLLNLDDTPFAPLSFHLLDLLEALADHQISLALVGGFGLFLRREWRLRQSISTLIQPVPPARATEDFDLLLSLELLAQIDKMKTLEGVLQHLGYGVLERARNFQFIKPDTAGEGRRNVKIDLLSPAPLPEDARFQVKAPRVKVLGSPLHAYLTPEALASQDHPLVISLEGQDAAGRLRQGKIHLPNPYTLLLMKLHAFRDEHTGRKGPNREHYAEKHALDLFTIITLLTLEENNQLNELASRYQTHSIAQGGAHIVSQFFNTPNSTGILAVRSRLREGYDTRVWITFVEVLNETFRIFPPA
jgi:hypothetical protein